MLGDLWTPAIDLAFPAAALLWLTVWLKRKARNGGNRPGLKSDPEKDKTLYTLSDREGEALPPFLASFCRQCAEGVCDRAEHLGLTDEVRP